MKIATTLLGCAFGAFALSCAKEPGTDTAATDTAAMTTESPEALGGSQGGAKAVGSRTGAPGAPAVENVVTVGEEVPGLLALARFHSLDAQHVAQTKFPTGKVLDGMIERRGGDLVYNFRIRDDNTGIVHAVLVDAMDGKLITSITEKGGGKP